MNASPTNPLGAKQKGDAAEDAVAQWLAAQGVKVLYRNLRLGMLELDIVAKEGATILVVEVRTRSRSSWTSAFSSISPTKRMRLRRAGERLWRRSFRNDQSIERMRFDVAGVSYEGDCPIIEYVPAAF